MKYEALKECVVNGVAYAVGDEINVASAEQLVKLSEKGFIRTLTLKEIQNFRKEEPKKIFKKEEE